MKIGHIALYTKDLNESAKFYSLFGGKKGAEGILNLENGTSKHLLHIEFEGETTIELVCPSDPAMMPTGNGLCEHFCFAVENIDETIKELRAKGIDTFRTEEPYDSSLFGGIRIIFLTGPSGELIELFQQR